MPVTLLKARWIAPVATPPIENGLVAIENGCIADIRTARSSDRADEDFGDAIIVPGFVNAHTHLELTLHHNRVAFAGTFAGWLAALLKIRETEDLDAMMREARPMGLRQSIEAGVTTIGDIGSQHDAMEDWWRSPINVVGFREVLGIGPMTQSINPRSAERVIQDIEGFESRAETDGPIHAIGLTPHSPYSVTLEAFRHAANHADKTARPVTTHVAETLEEVELLRDGTGPIRDFLETLDLWDGSFQVPGCSPIAYLDGLGFLDCRPLLVHANYVSDDDMDRIASSNASVAFCPRSHAFFQHTRHRYVDMLRRGINVCLGTDSLASNDTLSLLDEARFLRSRDSTIDSEQLLRMATLNGSQALGLAGRTGSIESGKQADFVVIPLAHASTREPLSDLMSSQTDPRSVYVCGNRLTGTI